MKVLISFHDGQSKIAYHLKEFLNAGIVYRRGDKSPRFVKKPKNVAVLLCHCILVQAQPYRQVAQPSNWVTQLSNRPNFITFPVWYYHPTTHSQLSSLTERAPYSSLICCSLLDMVSSASFHETRLQPPSSFFIIGYFKRSGE